ncbi:MAG: polyprenyl synthetase family protein [Ardenticatenaceae bacterium]|nr:polyprenyl synthetase family protein [Ardenticatenaceae bacterium]
MTDIDAMLSPYIQAVEREIQRRVPPTEGGYCGFYGMLHYHLGWANADFEPEVGPRGKRIRSALCLLTCEALRGDFVPALPAAAAVELLHEFSLVHDDIEDGDRERRHRPTVWANWGKAQAINAGDGLYALAQLALLGLSEHNLPPDLILKAQQRFNETAVRLCQGQFLDISFERRPMVGPDEYLAMISGKTAALVGCAVELGGLVAGASADDLAALQTFGEALGLAFQMRDDLLGLWGDPQRTGKPAGNDIRKRKKSLPVMVALAGEGPASACLREIYARRTLDDRAVAEALALIAQTGARDQVHTLAYHESERALAALDRLSVPAERLAPLRTLAEALLERDY